MSTLIVQLPARDPAVASEEWHLPELPFMLLDRHQKVLRSGRATLATLPRASRTVLMVAARDLVLLQLTLPPVKGMRLMQALPNVVEDLLIQDAQTCHLAVDPTPVEGGQQIVAALDRNWFRFVCEGFRAAGHQRLKAVPIMRCLPPPQAHAAAQPELAPASTTATADMPVTPAAVLVAATLGEVLPTTPLAQEAALFATSAQRPLELALARGALGEGMALQATKVITILDALAGPTPVEMYRLTEIPGSTVLAGSDPFDAQHSALALPFEALARAALHCTFDLCQFEFANQPLRISRATLQRWRVPIWLASACLVLGIAASNLDWLILSREAANLLDQQTELLLSTFPKTNVVLDPPVQMSHELSRLRAAAGLPAADDFLSLSNALARAMAPVAPGTISEISYRDHSLRVTFAASVKLGDNFATRLEKNGLSASQDGTSWIITSHP